MIKKTKTILFAMALYISVAGLITFSQFILEEAFQTVMFGTWPAKNVKAWGIVKVGTNLMVMINNRSKTINRWAGWIQPIAYFAYDSYADAADYYIIALRAEILANEPGLFEDEHVTFEFRPKKVSRTDDGRYLVENGRVGFITGLEVNTSAMLKTRRMSVSGTLKQHGNLWIVDEPEKLLKLSSKEEDDDDNPEQKGRRIYTAAYDKGRRGCGRA